MKHLKMVINLADCPNLIHKEIYGHFIEHAARIINDGLFVGKNSPIPNHNGVRTDIIEGYKEIGVSMLHWPGGAEAENDHWRDGIGPNRKSDINCWTGRDYSNEFGTHEFLDLCEELQCEPYIVFNVGSATVQETADWMELSNRRQDFVRCLCAGKGEILQGDPHHGNHFDDEEKIASAAFDDFSFTGDGIAVRVPRHSIVALHLFN